MGIDPGSAAAAGPSSLPKVDDLSDKQQSLLKAIIEIREQNREPMWREMASRAGVAKGSLGYLLETLEKKGFVDTKRVDGIFPLKRPDGQPWTQPAKKTQPAKPFTRTATVAAAPSRPRVVDVPQGRVKPVAEKPKPVTGIIGAASPAEGYRSPPGWNETRLADFKGRYIGGDRAADLIRDFGFGSFNEFDAFRKRQGLKDRSVYGANT